MSFGIVKFSNDSILTCSCSTEISKRDGRNLIGDIIPFQDFFKYELGMSIRIDRLFRMIFLDYFGYRFSIDRSRRGKYDFFYSIFIHSVQKIQPSYQIIMIIFIGINYAIRH